MFPFVMEHQAVQNLLSVAPAFLNTRQTAQFLGLSKAMVRKMVHTRQMPVRRFGRAVRIPFAWLAAEVNAARVTPAVHQS